MTGWVSRCYECGCFVSLKGPPESCKRCRAREDWLKEQQRLINEAIAEIDRVLAQEGCE